MIAKNLTVKLPRILIAACDHELRAVLKHALERAAYVVDECTSQCALRNTLASVSGFGLLNRFDALLFEKRMLDERAVTMMRKLQQRELSPPLVLLTGWSGECGADSVGLRISAVISQPADVARCTSLIRRLVPHRRLIR